VTVNSSFTVPLTALVKDSGGNPLSGVAVSFTAPSSGATGSFATGAMATIVTDATGSASASFTANPVAGSYTVNASVPGVASPALFSLTNLPGPPARISATSGSGQSTSINTPFNNLLVAMVQDAVGNAVSGVTVMFAAPVSGASGTFSGSTTIATNAAGIATAPTFQANSIGGTYQVSATAAGVANPATFALTNSSGIVLPAAVTVQPGLSTPYPIELGAPAPAGGVFIALASSNTATITVTPLSVLIPAGSTTPTVIPRVTGINLGSANISASAWTYQTVSQQASVTDALSFYPSAATVSAGASLFVTLTLFAPLPASLTVSLSSSNPAIATAPSTVTLPANTTSQTIRLTGLVSGSTNITAR
jgi:hypothetical protein